MNLREQSYFLKDIDRKLMYLDKPIKKIKKENITLYHGSHVPIKNEILPAGINVGATPYSDVRWSCFFWDKISDAIPWALFRTIRHTYEYKCIWGYEESKVLVKEDFDYSLVLGGYIYVYEVIVNIDDVAIGSHPSIREYTVDDAVHIHKTHKIKITKELLDKLIIVCSKEELQQRLERLKAGMKTNNRNILLNLILDPERDLQRKLVSKAVQNNEKEHGSKPDLSRYKSLVNKKLITLNDF